VVVVVVVVVVVRVIIAGPDATASSSSGCFPEESNRMDRPFSTSSLLPFGLIVVLIAWPGIYQLDSSISASS
jgi:hypothetical protein